MSAPLHNLRLLRDDMREKGWVVDVFPFSYKNDGYFVVVELYQLGQEKPEYTLCKLIFMDKANLDRKLISPANTGGLMIKAKELREYFRIAWDENIGDIIRQFSERLGSFIPTNVKENRSRTENGILVRRLSNADSEDPGRIYCYKVKHNPKRKDGTPGRRSLFNDNKARILRPKLFEVFKSDPSVSFCFTDDPAKERNDELILQCYTDGEMEFR